MPDLSNSSLCAVRRLLRIWEVRCLHGQPDQLGGVSLPVFHGWLYIYATRAVQRLMQLCRTRTLPDPVVRMVAAAAFGAVRYLIHAGTTWTTLLTCVTGFQLDQLRTPIRWMLYKITPHELRSWERNDDNNN